MTNETARAADQGSGLQRHGPALIATLVIGAGLLATRSGVVAFLDRVGGHALVPFAEGIFGVPAEEGGDKVVHAILFFVYTGTLARSFAPRRARSSGGLSAAKPGTGGVWLAGLVSFAYSGTLEILQGFVGRDRDPWDLLANGIGVGLCVAWQLLRRRGR